MSRLRKSWRCPEPPNISQRRLELEEEEQRAVQEGVDEKDRSGRVISCVNMRGAGDQVAGRRYVSRHQLSVFV